MSKFYNSIHEIGELSDSAGDQPDRRVRELLAGSKVGDAEWRFNHVSRIIVDAVHELVIEEIRSGSALVPAKLLEAIGVILEPIQDGPSGDRPIQGITKKHP